MSFVTRNIENLQVLTHAYLPMCQKYGWRRVNPAGLKRIAVFPKTGILFNRVKKNANTTTLGILTELETGQTPHHKTIKKTTPILGCKNQARAHRNLEKYSIITVKRNPYTRVLSAFLEKFRHERFRHRHGQFDLTPEGFESFLRWLDEGGLTKDPHWDLQIKLMALPPTLYDTVIRFEHFADDLRHLLQERTNQPLPSALHATYASDKDKATRAASQLNEFYTTEAVQIVRRIYRVDFDQLEYDDTSFPSS
ncbi:sulfotransferase family 2 domain-containing protein [Thioalkalivibrio sp. ALgr3]|uniref:sulfotransferase family 2 domain-containing protein n=1 Tax=Thioalkalivibrio sp. ALgr3 TaxID=1239292 RepID=UPI00037F6A49|nr:sulfotransferase family 2 domain-containing protein [Thioalkalivibrio sp. ALgr3]